MAHGAPDWMGSIGKTVLPVYETDAKQSVSAYSFAAEVGVGGATAIDLPVPADGYENIFTDVVVGCDTDEAVQQAIIARVSDAWVFFTSYFILNAHFSIPQAVGIPSTEMARLTLKSNHTAGVIFSGVVYYITRKL